MVTQQIETAGSLNKREQELNPGPLSHEVTVLINRPPPLQSFVPTYLNIIENFASANSVAAFDNQRKVIFAILYFLNRKTK